MRFAALEQAGIDPARPEAEWLLAGLLDVERFALPSPAGAAAPPTEAQAARYRELIERRARREPLQYLLGWEDFHGLRLAVTPDVLVPRPETEGLVEWALEALAGRPDPVIADLGTRGRHRILPIATACPASGAIAVALATRGAGRADAVRVPRAAARPCSPNGAASPGRVPPRGTSSRRSARSRRTLDLVVANPPYLPSAVIASLPPEVSRHEPRAALDGGPDGLGVLRRIVAGAPAVLKPGGWLLMEIGEEQAARSPRSWPRRDSPASGPGGT